MTVALRGNLEDFGIAEIFQLIGQQRKTGVLEFRGDGDLVRLRFDQGAVVAASPVGARSDEALGDVLVRCGRLTREQVDELHRECEASAQSIGQLVVGHGLLAEREIEEIEDLLTRDTFFAILRWSTGSFDFRSEAVEHTRRFETLLGAEQMLMDGLRMVDEWQSFAEFVPSENLIFQPTGGFDAYIAAVGGNASQLGVAEALFRLVNGRLPVRRVVDLSLLGTFDAVRLLAQMRRAGAIAPLGHEGLRQLRRSQRTPMVSLAQARATLAALIPLALLVLVWSLAARVEPTTAPGAIPMLRAPLESLRQAYATRRVRHALETHRFREGGWPDELVALQEGGFLDDASLAQASPRPYYYVEKASGALLLAPER